ncbi:site-specific integrase [Nocardia cyriacigeorgica]|uniref:Site-specific integrase n=1 Tax=Nocardia cyriacigeorgica TaxID=135487 RepID=A0A6P1CLR8_9NOCA|nr:site-specific integrase [Nocardia cyriacigeorgica]MBF6496542.1 site-specific integrase [Nocardia cyriacigeorgica]NEW32827.1 site-specific integrase [Nocardia cyriacigeorgica]
MNRVPDSDDFEVARIFLRRLGITPEQLLGASSAGRTAPTFAAIVPLVYASMPDSQTREIYNCYWRKLLAVEGWADRRIDEPSKSDFVRLFDQLRAERQVRSSDRGGQSVIEHAVSALRRLYQYAVECEFIAPADNIARQLDKPVQLESRRHALPASTLTAIYKIAATTGQDPELDVLLLRLHTETACRRGGAIGLRPIDLNAPQCLIRLREKGRKERWQPVSPSLMAALLRHATERGATGDQQLLRSRKGVPIAEGRYRGLFSRLARYLPEIAMMGISIHWMRHTTLTWVERNYSEAVARAYAGHTRRPGRNATAVYTSAGLQEIADALSALTGEPHPIATSADTAERNSFWGNQQ